MKKFLDIPIWLWLLWLIIIIETMYIVWFDILFVP